MILCRLQIVFNITLYSKYFFRNNIRALNSLDPDQHAIRPDLGTNCLQRLSADDKIYC